MDLAAFEAVFRGGIRAQLAWEIVADASAGVVEHVLTAPGALGPLRTVWYTGADGREGSWRDPDSVALTVAEAASARWSEDRQRTIEGFRRMFASAREPVVLVFPAYVVGSSLLLLDGSHRAVAAHVAVGSGRSSRTSCAHRHATAILAAHRSASSRDATSTTANPPTTALVSGYGPPVTAPSVPTMLACWLPTPAP